MSHALSRAERRLLARRGISMKQIYTAANRAGGTERLREERSQHEDFGALPKTAADWADWVGSIKDAHSFTEKVNSGEFKAAINSYVTAKTGEHDDLLRQVREQVESNLTEWLKDHQGDLPSGGGIRIPSLDETRQQAGARPSAVYNNPRAAGFPLNGVWPDFYTYLQDVHMSSRGMPLNADQRKRIDAYNAYQEKNPSDGGYLVPEEFRSSLLQLSLENAVVRPNATIIPMGAPRLHIPMVDETSRVSSIWGGVVVYRTEEGGEIPESAASFAAIKLDVTKQTALSHVPNELIRDWGAFGAFMDATLPAAMGYYEDLDYISGSGVGAPLGALHPNNTALVVVPAQGGQSTATIVWENCIAMYARMLPSSLNSAMWLASPDAFVQLATMALSVGTGGSAVWLTDGHNAPVLTLLGRPVRMSEKAPAALGSQGDLSFIDWKQYLVGDYQTMTVESSPHVKFTSDKTTFRAIARNDGRPWLQAALTPHNNSASLSPYIQLAARP